MTTAKYYTEHKVFHNWFLMHYPELSKKHRVNILPATDESGFVIKTENMDKETANEIQKITETFYRLIRT